MIEVAINSIRVSLMSQNRIVVLQEKGVERYLPIWIGPFEADAMTIALQNMDVARPLTHDLLSNILEVLDAVVKRVVVTELREETYYAEIVLDVNGREIAVDSRPSDAIALAIRVQAPIFVAEEVMEESAVVPEEGLSLSTKPAGRESEEITTSEEDLGAFADFIKGLDLDTPTGSEESY